MREGRKEGRGEGGNAGRIYNQGIKSGFAENDICRFMDIEKKIPQQLILV